MSIDFVYSLNVASRIVLLAVAVHKAYNERRAEWIYISLAFALAAFTPEPFLLEPLGFRLNLEVAYPLSMVNVLTQGVFAMLAAFYVKEAAPPVEKRTIPIILGILAYFWIVITNASEFNLTFTTKVAVPIAVYSLGYIYLGYTILKYSPPGNVASRIFSLSMVFLGLLNATYPYTATLNWFRPYGFALGTLLRVIMAVGAFGVAFWPVGGATVDRKVSQGAVLVTSSNDWKLVEEIGKTPNSILVTRNDLRQLESLLDPSVMVFWITRVTEGELGKRPYIYAISPTRLGILLDLITRAVESGYNTVYVDSVEYMILENGFNTALKFLLSLKDRVIAREGRIILTIDPRALDEKQLKILKREFEELS